MTFAPPYKNQTNRKLLRAIYSGIIRIYLRRFGGAEKINEHRKFLSTIQKSICHGLAFFWQVDSLKGSHERQINCCKATKWSFKKNICCPDIDTFHFEDKFSNEVSNMKQLVLSLLMKSVLKMGNLMMIMMSYIKFEYLYIFTEQKRKKPWPCQTLWWPFDDIHATIEYLYIFSVQKRKKPVTLSDNMVAWTHLWICWALALKTSSC